MPWNLSSHLVLTSSGLISKVFFDAPSCLRKKYLIECSLDIPVAKWTLDDLADGLIPFLLHHESYLVYEKGHKLGHGHQLQEVFHVYLTTFENVITHLFLVILGNN